MFSVDSKNYIKDFNIVVVLGKCAYSVSLHDVNTAERLSVDSYDHFLAGVTANTCMKERNDHGQLDITQMKELLTTALNDEFKTNTSFKGVSFITLEN